MDTPIEAQYDPWGRSVLNALRRWIIVPIAIGLVGGAAGLVAGSTAKPSAEALLRVESSAADGAAMKIVQESTMLELDTAPIYNAGAEATGTTPADLRARTQIAAVPDSQLISVTVTAGTAEQAIAEADAIADTGIEINEARIDGELDQVTKSTRKLIKNNKLSDKSAEQSRVSRLGDTLGQNQSNLVVGSRNLVLLHSAEAASLLPSPLLLGALGLVGGGLLGAVIALLLGARRGSIQSVREMHQLYPNASVVDRLDLETVISLESENASVVYIAAVGQDPHELEPIADAVRTQFLAHGREVDGYDPHRNVKVAERVGHLQVITTTLSDTVLRRVQRDSSSLLIIPVKPKVTRMEQLEAFAPRLTDRTYLLVEPVAPDWD
ncbi:MAG: hypothetical protein L0H41_09705 [Microlunatus sp.]|nr:hypothetical protein [Microlunatus sp.]MDN5770198.1 hypothetical protein [Microlunatus sp.]